MKRPKIKVALLSAFSLIGAIIIAFATYAIVQLSGTNSHVREVATDWLPSVQISEEMDTGLSDLRLAFNNHVNASDSASIAAAEQAIVTRKDAFLNLTVQYEALRPNDKATIAAVRSGLNDYLSNADALLGFSRVNDDEKAKFILTNTMRPIADKIGGLIDEMVASDIKGANEAYTESQSEFDRTLTVTFLVISVCLSVILAAVYFAFAGIARPIEIITSAMRILAQGDTKTAIPYSGRTDEIGDMAAAVEVFRRNALENLRLEQEGKAQRTMTEEERARHEVAQRQRAEDMMQATQGLGQGLKHLAAGNLSFHLLEPFAEDFETLRADFNASVDQLSDVLRSVTSSALSIDGGTREISQSADDLSRRTEQQAASLEETAAALDQITVNVAHSSKRADEARSIAIEANQSATHSGQVVANAVTAMQKIEASSNEIASIISVIDQIAFQTNLLALNAGVEAARAGDAGKGFAVVAQEVRELAQRSAHAAKEINALISASKSEVESGVKLVKDTGTALKTIEGFVATINQHMDAIATSAREQSVGLSEVNTAVNQMDQVTQQNAAMVEETTAASATLAAESGTLRRLIEQFDLGTQMGGSSRSSLVAFQHARAAA
ncbi:methyl-accepting chemotaxis protein (plasmid) [Agrobacterium rosae]|uniref:HAMP domain-containing methyl-accepting chemotaxis protein n=1 Tax=Agrobacterium rosae TaxID=1972867 RepID=A0ABU4W311_9HYPH|nr:HAMP domain-containing methyl-accepting chemotaxis protein [Agrobacterium rosae]MDX8331812.1 HAMP domain-containing methyl-accepting chemotaxis protein [Agrobacterium rosae]